MLGVDIKDEEIKKILNNYHYEFTHSRDGWEVVIPEMRLDLTMPCDFVEEIGRAYGYDKVKGELPKIDFERKDDETWTRIVLAKDKLIKDGYREVLTYAFTDKGEVEILASASDKNFLRTNLSDGLKESIKLNTLNLPLFDMKEVKVFEVGTIFTKNGSASAESFGEIKEEIHVVYGDKKNVIEMPLDKFFAENISPEVHVLGSTVLQGTSGETSLSRTFKMWSFYPFISRDIAVWIPKGTDKDNLKKIFIEEGTGLLVKEPYLFDSFEKGDKTSYAYRLVFQSYEKTLTDEEINPIMTKIYEKIIFFGWEIR